MESPSTIRRYVITDMRPKPLFEDSHQVHWTPSNVSYYFDS